jgi:hypothetical protein
MMRGMRTTVTLEPDVQQLVERAMRERRIGFKEAVNAAIRAGLAPDAGQPARTPTFSMGFDAAIPLDRALRLAADLEDEELVRRLAERK